MIIGYDPNFIFIFEAGFFCDEFSDLFILKYIREIRNRKSIAIFYFS